MSEPALGILRGMEFILNPDPIQKILTSKLIDILLNVFLAIAVDNLGDAEEMDAIEKQKEVINMA